MRPEGRSPDRLDVVALVATLIGAPLAVALMLYVGKNNPSRLLLGAFTLWVLGPFAMLLVAYRLSAAWSTATRTTLRFLMWVVPAATVIVYAATAFGPASGRNAFWFVLLPPLSSVLIVCCLSMPSMVNRWRARSG